MGFTAQWKGIEDSLEPELEVKNWTAKKGYLGDRFTIFAICPNSITVHSPGAKNPQVIPRGDFETVEGLWEDYCSGATQRQHVRDVTRFSKYIISILHFVQGTNGIQALSWGHNGMKMQCEVGGPLPAYFETGPEPVLEIIDCGDCFEVYTESRTRGSKGPVLAGRDSQPIYNR
jgi:hypothetical protein